MNITGNNSIQNYVFDGGYAGFLSPEGLSFVGAVNLLTGEAYSMLTGANINPTGVTGYPVYFHSGELYIDSGYLASGKNKSIVSGASETPSSSSGYLFTRISKPLIGVCHGFGRDIKVWYSGFNFYNAFHPEGYFAPPFGQHITVVQENEDGRTALDEDGSCSSLTADEYNDLFGIVSNTDSAVDASSNGLNNNAQTFINSPAIACPQDLSVTFYWHEKQYRIIAGTSAAIAGNIFYNNNPIPTTLDNFYSKTKKRYDDTEVDTNTMVDMGGYRIPRIEHTINFSGGKPVPAFSTSVGTNIINSLTCPGLSAEGGVNAGVQPESQLLIAPDILSNPSKSDFDFFNWWNIWHFLFKENSDGFPFSNDYNNDGMNVGLAKTVNSANHGSQLFESTLSSSDAYWDRRQCPEAISALPHTFGASIYACPSYHFDVPYYAALNKFGFYGTRFLNGCVSLQLQYPLGGSPNVLEISSGTVYTTPEESEPNNDKGGNGGFSIYSNLLRIAKAEEKSSDFYALNKILFLWANKDSIKQSSDYAYLSSNDKFNVLFDNLFNQFNAAFPSGKSSLISGQPLFESGAASTLYATGAVYDILASNREYAKFRSDLAKALDTTGEIAHWNSIENTFGQAFMTGTNIDTGFYNELSEAKEARLRTRYLENFVKGNAIDLYPTNKIYFSFDKAGDVIDSIDWGKSNNGFGASHEFNDEKLSRRYFLGAYGNGDDVSGLAQYLAGINSITGTAFHPGFFNSNLGLELPTPTYTPSVSGYLLSGTQRTPIGDAWAVMGYNGIGEIRRDSSCFTPIFIQQPLNKVHCKIGQSPTFRALAVDYHTIPEDKMNIRYPEIVYWMKKLKLCDSKYNNRYPLTYKWYRIKKIDCNNDFKNFLLDPDFTKVSPSSVTGEWCALEGDGPLCTLIHPKECEPVFEGNGAWAYRNRNTIIYNTAQQNNFYMTFKKGAIKSSDDSYYYFCMARGRFGIRVSEPSELFIEDWLKFDLSVQNGGNVSATPVVEFKAQDKSLPCSATSVSKYAGFVKDEEAIPEDIAEMQIPPPNRGWGDVYSLKFVGLWGYRGAAQTYVPGTLKDTRGLKETWGRFLHYGSLTQYNVPLTQEYGDFLYGRNHLPVCENHAMADKKDGIKVVINGVVHWANMQHPAISTNGNYGVRWDKLGNAGELYVPSMEVTNAGQVTVSPGLGQWQWGNNLGTIHRFGWNSSLDELTQTPGTISEDDLIKLKQKLVSSSVLAGPNCGWHKNGLGRNMLYWIEGFSSFYLYCDQLKKKNVSNYNYMNPGLRQTNSSMQYFWMGKPNNAYLERYPLFGPYAYQWKVRRHNRDRNGNGISEGFYSYGWNSNYSLQYDAPAIYGLFMKYEKSATKNLEEINAARSLIFGTNTQAVKTIRFGFTNGEGTSKTYGDIWVGNRGDTNYEPARDYMNSGASIAENPEFGLYGCSDADVKAGRCFDPCLSMRYQFGFLAGGKKQDLTTSYPNGNGYRMVANSPSFTESTVANASGTYFRGAFGTPHLQMLRSKGFGVTEINGFSPCFDGGADHCNYITPTLNYGTSVYQEAQRSTFMMNANLAAQAVNL